MSHQHGGRQTIHRVGQKGRGTETVAIVDQHAETSTHLRGGQIDDIDQSVTAHIRAGNGTGCFIQLGDTLNLLTDPTAQIPDPSEQIVAHQQDVREAVIIQVRTKELLIVDTGIGKFLLLRERALSVRVLHPFHVVPVEEPHEVQIAIAVQVHGLQLSSERQVMYQLCSTELGHGGQRSEGCRRQQVQGAIRGHGP